MNRFARHYSPEGTITTIILLFAVIASGSAGCASWRQPSGPKSISSDRAHPSTTLSQAINLSGAKIVNSSNVNVSNISISNVSVIGTNPDYVAAVALDEKGEVLKYWGGPFGDQDNGTIFIRPGMIQRYRNGYYESIDERNVGFLCYPVSLRKSREHYRVPPGAVLHYRLACHSSINPHFAIIVAQTICIVDTKADLVTGTLFVDLQPNTPSTMPPADNLVFVYTDQPRPSWSFEVYHE